MKRNRIPLKTIPCFLGIDPGKNGCLCAYFPKGSNVLFGDPRCVSIDNYSFIDWPKDDTFYDIIYVLQTVNDYCSIQTLLEKVSSMPKQGVKSMFTFGRNLGRWEGILTTLGIPFVMQTPQEWQKGIITKSDGKDSKTRAKVVASRLLGKDSSILYGKCGGYKDGRADAFLMAWKASQL